jgi:hypothetical protein
MFGRASLAFWVLHWAGIDMNEAHQDRTVTLRPTTKTLKIKCTSKISAYSFIVRDLVSNMQGRKAIRKNKSMCSAGAQPERQSMHAFS